MRNYKKKKVAKYSEEDLKNAIHAINQKIMNQSEASLAFSIPRATLQLHLGDKPKVTKIGAGRNTVLSKESEETIAETLKTMAKWGFGLTRLEVLEAVAEYVTVNEIKNPFKDNMPGEDWFLSFKKRHNLSLRLPEAKQSSRYDQFTADKILPFFTLLATEIKNLGLVKKPNLIFNLDETGFAHDPLKVKVVGEVGQPLTRRTHGAGRAQTTVVGCVSASAQVFQPHIVFKSLQCTVRQEWKSETYLETTYDATESGWMTSKAFLHYMTYIFLPQAPKERPLLVVFDGYLSHLAVDVIKFALDNEITLIKLPAHTTDQMQPLDKVLFRPVKEKYNRLLIKWQREHYGIPFKKQDVANLVNQSWTALTKTNIFSGFATTGIYDVTAKFPVNPLSVINKFPKDQVDKFKQTPEYNKMLFACEMEGRTEENLGLESGNISSSKPCTPDDDVNLQRKTSFESLMLEKLTKIKALRKTRKSKEDTSTGEVVTSPVFLEKAKEKEARKQERLQKRKNTQPKVTKKNLFKRKTLKKNSNKKHSEIDLSSEEDENENLLLKDEIESSTSSGVTAKDRTRIVKLDMHMKKVQNNLEEEQYYCVYYDKGMHVGRIVDMDIKKKEVTMKFLTRVTYAEPQFDWPKKDDVDLVNMCFVFFGPLKLVGHGPFDIPQSNAAEKMYKYVDKYKNELFPTPFDNDSDFD